MDTRLANIVVVMLEPQDDINIGTAVRACKNFGISDIRLVRPRKGNPKGILISAPRAQDLISKIQRFDTLEEALADTTLVLATTARTRKGVWISHEPRTAAQALLETAQEAKAALLFGREDSGLPNEALDRCHGTITVPTDPDYSSLNLGQAVLLTAYEVFREAQGALGHCSF